MRGTSDKSVGRAYSIFIHNMVFLNKTYDMFVNTQFHKFYGKSFKRFLYTHEGYRSVTPGPLDAARVNKQDDFP